MKTTATRLAVRASNAWGQTTTCDHTEMEVEAADIGATRENYLGHHYGKHTFTRADVGRKITIYTSPGWTCWAWGSIVDGVASPQLHKRQAAKVQS